MINAIIEGLYSFLFDLVGYFTTPISSALSANFPDLTTHINTINTFFNGLASVIAWFFYLVPKPLTAWMVTAFVLTVITAYPLMITIELIGKTLDLIKRIFPFNGK